MQLWKKMKKNRKGFTLVEIIVVLVILAILAAFTIPAMLGFVNDARAKAEIAQAREVYVAAQSATTESAATNNGVVSGDVVVTTVLRLVSGDLGLTASTLSTSTDTVAKTKPKEENTAIIYYNANTAKVTGVVYRGESDSGIVITDSGSEVLK